MSKIENSLGPLNIIRTETVLSKMPFHNLTKSGRVDLHITKKNDQGEIELYWDVSESKKYGLPGQLAYKIDTIIVNKRLDELGRPLPRIIRLGSLKEICQELGLVISGRTIAQIRRALRQNASAFITAKLKYRGNDGLERLFETGFSRYSVVFTGERLPNGEKADAVYLILNEQYWEVLNHAPVRPLDYDYLKDLSPTAQRFYEIISYRMFVALKHGHSQAMIYYSDLCLFSGQVRYYDYQPFRKQMYKIHKPHLDSGYIKKVEYEQTKDSVGKTDWLMRYTPGPKAEAEYKSFNTKNKANRATIRVKPLPAKDSSEKPLTALVSGKNEGLELVQYFHKQARDIDDYKPYNGSKEQNQAAALISSYGMEKAKSIVDFAVAAARKTHFQMRTFGALFQYLNDALAHSDQQEAEEQRLQTQQAAEQKEQEEVIEAHLRAIAGEQYQALYERVKAQVLSDVPALAKCQDSPVVQTIIKEEMVKELARQERKKKGSL